MTDPAFRIEATWPSPPIDSRPDQAHIGITLDDALLTRLAVIEERTLRDYFRASAVSLALWWADNWWRLRWETLKDQRRPSADWRLRHEMTSAAGGTLWPPIMFYGTGTRVIVAPTFGSNLHAGPVRHLDLDVVHSIAGPLYEAGVDAFFARVIEVCARAQDGAALTSIVAELRMERDDPDNAAWRSLEAMLGFDPDEAPDGLMLRLAATWERFGREAIGEAAVAAPGPHSADTLQAAVDAAEASSIAVDTGLARWIDGRSIDRGTAPWQAAERAAASLRRAIGHERGTLSNDVLADLLGASWSNLKAAPPTARDLPYGARVRTEAGGTKIALQTRAGVDRRFELARVIGDIAWDDRSEFGIVSRSRTERQKFQRAFAQSLLCPFSEIGSSVDLADPSEEDIVDSAKRFGVNPLVVQTLLVNKGVLPRDTLQDRLEAA